LITILIGKINLHGRCLQVKRLADQEYTPTISIPLKATVALLLAKMGFQRDRIETLFPLASGSTALAYANGTQRTADITPAVYAYYSGIRSTWFAHNEEMLSGTLPVRFRPDIRVGNALKLTRTLRSGTGTVKLVIKFYIQGVKHNFNAQQGSSSTTLTLVRGVIQDKKRPEANLFWTSKGPRLLDNPYEVLRDVIGLR
jgi:hypothetical protein